MNKVICIFLIILIDLFLLTFEFKIPFKNKTVKFNAVCSGLAYYAISILNFIIAFGFSKKQTIDLPEGLDLKIMIAVTIAVFLTVFAVDKVHYNKSVKKYVKEHEEYEDFIHEIFSHTPIAKESLMYALIVSGSTFFVYSIIYYM